MNRVGKIASILFLIGLLVSIRAFESDLFYDPLIQFFKTDHTTGSLPEFDTIMLPVNVGLRYLANTLVSLAILWVLFKDSSIIKLSSLFFLIFFVLLLIVFSYLLYYSNTADYIALFYVRRLLIHPLPLLILIPAFYFHRLK